MSTILTLDIKSWSVTLNGEHFTGDVYDADFNRTEITHKMSSDLAAALNKKDGTRIYKAGMPTGRFTSHAQIVHHGIMQALHKYPDAKLILLGDHCAADPLLPVWCSNEEIGRQLQTLYEQNEAFYKDTVDPYIAHRQEMEAVWQQWERLLDKLRRGEQ